MKSSLLALHSLEGPERVGVVLKDGKLREFRNIAFTPDKTFSIDADELIPLLPETISSWHTHPHASSMPSVEDLHFFRRWPELTHYIIGRDGLREYEVRNGEVVCK